MKQVLQTAFLLLVLTCKGQTLTRAQVYNFDVGDIISGSYSAVYNFNQTQPPTNKTSTILSKTVTINNDSIIYNIKQNYYTPPACQTCSASSSTTIITQIITNLNSAISNSNATTCYSTGDTLFLAYCNKRTYEIHPVNSSSITCFEPTTETTQYVEGVGGPFYNKFVANAPNYNESFTLDYYIKQSSSCPVGLSIIEQKNTLLITNIYPVPSKDIIHLTSDSELYRFDIFDMAGNMCLNGYIKNNQLNIEALNAGTYIAYIYSKDSKVHITKMIKA